MIAENYKEMPKEEWKRRYADELVRLGVALPDAKAYADHWYSRDIWDTDDSPEYAAECDLDACQ